MLSERRGEPSRPGAPKLPESAANMSDDAPFFALRNRAYELAETGRYKHWKDVALVLQAEGLVGSLIERLGRDDLAVMMITRCCTQARA